MNSCGCGDGRRFPEPHCTEHGKPELAERRGSAAHKRAHGRATPRGDQARGPGEETETVALLVAIGLAILAVCGWLA